MTISEMIYKDVCALIEEEGTRNPLHILHSKGVHVLPFSVDTDLLGMYSKVLDKPFVFYNTKLEEHLLNMVLAHELGHFIYHNDYQDIATSTTIVKKNNEEFEANIFAAHLLIDEKAVIEYLETDYSVYQIASALYVVPDLLIIKLNEMRKLGYPIPYNLNFDSSFFKSISGKNEQNWDGDFVFDNNDDYE